MAEGEQRRGPHRPPASGFAWLLEDHHGEGRLALNCKAPAGVAAELADAHPERYFLRRVPSGPRGWAGIWLDVPEVDWDEVERLVVEAYRMTAPKRLAASL